MESLKELYKIGNGPSSSHTMGPKKAAERFAERCHDADAYRVTLYGSLAATGKGHLTDAAILSVLASLAPTEIVWKPEVVLPFHPNGMLFEGLKAGNVADSWTIYSIGGGALANETSRLETPHSIYPLTTVSEIKAWCSHEGKTYWEYVTDCEGPEIWDYLDEIWTVMCETIQRGLNNDGVLPGGLKVARKASTYWVKSKSYTDSLKSRAQIYAYALATSEENASGGIVVTAPTCGSCGVVPAVLYHLANSRNFLRIRILRALATAGLFGNVAKTNASISGAEVGCQGEVGVACAMACYIETGKLPFDLAEAEQEIQEGPLAAYSGPSLAMMKLGVSLKQLVVASLFVAIFLPFGAAATASPLDLLGGLVAYACKVLAVFLVASVIENAVMRVRYKYLGRYTWFVVGIASLSLVFLVIGI